VTRDSLFGRFAAGVFTILVLYGCAMTGVVLYGDPSLASKMISGFGTMFAGVLGLGTGYLLGTATAANGRTDGR
jgi:hypothetical protein